MAANEAILKQGSPIMVDGFTGAAYLGGEVIVVGDVPMVSHRDNAAADFNALATRDGIYQMVGNALIAQGSKVYWDDTAKKVTETGSGNLHFGYTVDAGITADDATGWVLHQPNGEAAAA